MINIKVDEDGKLTHAIDYVEFAAWRAKMASCNYSKNTMKRHIRGALIRALREIFDPVGYAKRIMDDLIDDYMPRGDCENGVRPLLSRDM